MKTCKCRAFTIFAAIAVLLFPANTFSKSLYLISEHHRARFDSYDIGPDGTATYQARHTLTRATDPAGVAIWEDPQSTDSFIFITSEFKLAGVEIVDATTMQHVGIAQANATNLAGIDVDDINMVVYAVQRQTSNLYVYDWSPSSRSLTPRAGYSPYQLPNCGGAYGIALDETRGTLWVADTVAGKVRAYNTSNLQEDTTLGFAPIHNPVDVSVDRNRNIVYSVSIVGGGHADLPTGTGSRFLSKYDVASGVEVTHDMGWPGVGLAVDEITGYVYVTGGALSGDNLSIWDTSASPFSLIQDSGRIGNPAGIAISKASFNPLRLAKNHRIQGRGVTIGDRFAYHINWDNSFNPSLTVNNVTILDTLPSEADYISATNGGIYDPATHTVSWDIGTLAAGQPGPTIDLVVKVNNNATPGQTIHNYVTIDGDEIPPTTVIDQDPNNPNDDPGISIIDMCGDLNKDGDVDNQDRALLRGAFRTHTGDPGFIQEADYDGDGNIDYSDYQLWYQCYKKANSPT